MVPCVGSARASASQAVPDPAASEAAAPEEMEPTKTNAADDGALLRERELLPHARHFTQRVGFIRAGGGAGGSAPTVTTHVRSQRRRLGPSRRPRPRRAGCCTSEGRPADPAHIATRRCSGRARTSPRRAKGRRSSAHAAKASVAAPPRETPGTGWPGQPARTCRASCPSAAT